MFTWKLIETKTFSLNGELQLSRIHLLSQMTNIIAQNKIGSGFDISTAVYGSQIFIKLPENFLKDRILLSFSQMCDFFFLREELNLINNEFKLYESNLIKIPRIDVKILMIDFTIGSDTRILVGKVKEFLKENNFFVQRFYEASNEIGQILLKYFDNIKSQNEFSQIFQEKCDEYRRILKELGVYSHVEIEPDIITMIMEFLKKKYKDIFYCICPGAGGYDAVSCLMKSDCEVNIKDFEEKFEELKIGKYQKELKEIYESNKFNFVQDFEEIDKKLKNIEINIFERKMDAEGLKLVEL